MIDLHNIECVQVSISEDGKVLWLNTDEGCILRISNIKILEVVDDRSQKALKHIR